MTFKAYRETVAADLYRLRGSANVALFLRAMLMGGAFQYVFWMRTAAFFHASRSLRYSLYPSARIMLRRYGYRYGIDIPWDTRIGPGLYIGHSGGIVVNHNTVIGRNCNLSQGVTLGQGNRGPNRGYATVGDEVYFGPGAKVVGAVRIGSNVAVGANCVVTKDVPDGTTFAGVPGRVISNRGSVGYVTNCPP